MALIRSTALTKPINWSREVTTAMVIATHPDWSPERVVEARVSGADAVPGLEGLVRGGRLRWPL